MSKRLKYTLIFTFLSLAIIFATLAVLKLTKVDNTKITKQTFVKTEEKQNNIIKILDYLKRIGFVKYLQVTEKDILDPEKNIVFF